MSLQTCIFRCICRRSDGKRDAGLTTPADIERTDNIVYGTNRKWQSLDLYRPKNAAEKLPVIVSFHGGAWVYGTKEVYQYYCMSLAEHGFAVINYNYRLAPKHRFPAAYEDTNAVFHWLMQHAAEYNLDTDRIFAVGDSAGALGIGLYAAIVTNPEYAERWNFRVPDSLRIRALALNCGLYTTAGKAEELRNFLPKQNAEEALEMLDLIQHITADHPPCFVLTANRDFLREEPNALLPVLKQQGVPYRYQLYGSDAHPLAHVFHCDIRSKAAKRVNDAECAFFLKIAEQMKE